MKNAKLEDPGDFPLKAYSKYRSQSKTNPLLNKLSQDIGYPQGLIPFDTGLHRKNKNYLRLNKKGLMNFFSDRLPVQDVSILRESHTIDPSKLFQMKRKQHELKSLTKFRMENTFQIESSSSQAEHKKVGQIFFVNDKNLDFKKKFLDHEAKANLSVDQNNHRKGTASCIQKYSRIIKKQAYDTVFGADISATPRKNTKFRREQQEYFTRTQLRVSVQENSPFKSKTSEMKRKKFSSLIQKLDVHRQQFDPDNRLGVKPYAAPNQEQDKEQEKSEMITWIKFAASSYKQNSINCNIDEMKNLDDLEKMDEQYYRQMMQHKNRRLEHRSAILFRGNICSQNTTKAKPIEATEERHTKFNSDRKNLNEELSISDNNEGGHELIEDESKMKQQFLGSRLNIKQRFQKLAKHLVEILYYSKMYGMKDKTSIYNAFWKNPEPYEMPGTYAFFKAIKKNDFRGILKFLETNSDFMYEKDHQGRSPLIYAAVNNHTDIIKFLAAKDVNINLKSYQGKTALYYGIENQNIEVVEFLLQRGADPWSSPNCELGRILDEKNNQRLKNAMKNARRVSLAILLRPEKQDKLSFWRLMKGRINADVLIDFN